MTLILQFLNLEKNYMEFVEVVNAPCSNLSYFLAKPNFDLFIRWIDILLDKDFPETSYHFYGIFNGHRSRRKLLCSYDYVDWVRTSSID